MPESFPTRETPEGRSFRLLYLEEDPEEGPLIEKALTERGHVVCGVFSAEEMHLILDNEPIDAVLLDPGLREALVNETQEKLRMIERTTGKRIPLVALNPRGSTQSSVRKVESEATNNGPPPQNQE